MIDFKLIEELSKEKFQIKRERLESILAKALELKPLSLEESAYLLSLEKDEDLQFLRDAALKVKKKVYGDRIVLFAPLYLSNECANQCLYCGFQRENVYEKRKTLTKEEALLEANYLEKRGFKRALLVSAENKGICGVDYIKSIVRYLYDNSGLKILHLNAAPMEVEELREIKKEGVGVFQVFQETYHKETYEKLHIKGKKRDFNYRLTCMNRAIEAGFKDVGIGCLLGLYDYKFDVLATIAHSHFLRENFGTFPHTISVPRFRVAHGALMDKAPYPVDDWTFKKIVASYRLSIPTAGIVISTREPASLRDEILFFGASQISAESRTSPGGYTHILEEKEGAQFTLNDTRSLEEIVLSILEKGLLPSFCTACYKKERVGGDFHHLAEKNIIKGFCEKNALLTFNEYLNNLSDENLKKKMEFLFKKHLTNTNKNIERGDLV